MDCPARLLCDFFTSTILLTTDFCGTIPRATIKTTNLMQSYETLCIVKVFLLSEREISPNYTGIFLDFVHGFGSYVKGRPKMKRYNSVAVTVSVQIRCICETALRQLVLGKSIICRGYTLSFLLGYDHAKESKWWMGSKILSRL